MKEGWKLLTIGDVANIIHGKNQKEVLDSNGPYPIYGSGGSVMGYAKEYLCDEGTTILGRKGSINNPQYINTKFWNVDTAFGISAKQECNKRYLYHFITSINWNDHNSGTTLPSLTQSIVSKIEIPVPPLSEQDRIVKKLDEAFAKIDALKQNAEKGLQAVKDLWESSLSSLYIKKDNWITALLGTIVSFKNGVNFTPSSNGNKYRFLGVGDFQKRIEITPDEMEYVITSQAIESDYYLEKDDILIVRSNGSKSLVGRSVIIAENVIEPVIYSGFCIRCRVNDSLYAPFLNMLFKTKKVRKQLTYGDNGCNISNINQKKLSSLEISYPSIDEQKSLVEKLKKVLALCNSLQTNYEQELAEYEALKQSILRKAFCGEL